MSVWMTSNGRLCRRNLPKLRPKVTRCMSASEPTEPATVLLSSNRDISMFPHFSSDGDPKYLGVTTATSTSSRERDAASCVEYRLTPGNGETSAGANASVTNSTFTVTPPQPPRNQSTAWLFLVRVGHLPAEA